MINERLLNHLAIFGHQLITSEDVDPLYPVIEYYIKGMDIEQQLWFIALYLAYYNLPSAILAFQSRPYGFMGDSFPEMFNHFPIATERRNLRGGKIKPHLRDYLRYCRYGQMPTLMQGWKDRHPRENYECFWVTAQDIWQNGRWAAFKWAELLKKVLHWQLEAPDMRMEFCTGPKAGLELLYGHPSASVKQLNRYGEDLMLRLANKGVFIADWEQLETVLCNFRSLKNGRYYVGHDIDEMQTVIDKSALTAGQKEKLYAIRRAVLPNEYLGELHGWNGVDKSRMKLYQKQGLIVWRKPILLSSEQVSQGQVARE